MARDINVEEAASWSEEETVDNMTYLEARCRWEQMARVEELRGGPVQDTSLDEEYDASWNARSVAEWVGDDTDRAALALAAEKERSEPRQALTRRLEGLVKS